MDATHGISTWSPRRRAAAFASVTALAVIAGGTGGYLIHGTSTSTASAPVLAPVLLAPAEPPRALNGDSASGYSPARAGAPSHGLNGDSASSY